MQQRLQILLRAISSLPLVLAPLATLTGGDAAVHTRYLLVSALSCPCGAEERLAMYDPTAQHTTGSQLT